MGLLVACKNEEDPIKNEGARVVTTRAANSEVSDGILPKFKLIQSFMVGLVICKNKEEQIKNEGDRVVTRFPHYKPMGAICCHGNQSSDPILPKT